MATMFAGFMYKLLLSFVAVFAFHWLEADQQAGFLFSSGLGLTTVLLRPRENLYPIFLIAASVVGATTKQEMISFLSLIALTCEFIDRLYQEPLGQEEEVETHHDATTTLQTESAPAHIIDEIHDQTPLSSPAPTPTKPVTQVFTPTSERKKRRTRNGEDGKELLRKAIEQAKLEEEARKEEAIRKLRKRK